MHGAVIDEQVEKEELGPVTTEETEYHPHQTVGSLVYCLKHSNIGLESAMEPHILMFVVYLEERCYKFRARLSNSCSWCWK